MAPQNDTLSGTDPATKLWRSRFSAAKAAYHQGDLRQCERLLFRAMEQAKSLPDWQFATNSCHVGLGAVYLGLGDFEKARRHLHTAINALSGSGEPASRELYGVALRFYGSFLAATGDNTGAESNLQLAIKTLEDLGPQGAVQLAYALSDLAVLYVALEDLKTAREIIYSAMDILESALGPESSGYVRANIIYNLCSSKSEEELLTAIEDGLFRLQYQDGRHHPPLLRALGWYLKKRQDRGEMDKVEEARKRFDFHTTALRACGNSF